jgi:NAD(P)-dependent dehydrogenase (short-subunit alcohol dehydrogenase family)
LVNDSSTTRRVERRRIRRLEDKNTLITGSSAGKVIAISFAREGANVAINYLKGHDEAEITEKLVQHTCQSIREAGCKDFSYPGR